MSKTSPITDDQVVLPSAVRAAAQRAADAFNNTYGEEDKGENKGGNENQGNEDTQKKGDNENKGGEQNNGGEDRKPAQAKSEANGQESRQPTQNPDTTKVVTPEGNNPPAEDDRTWEHKFRSMKGRYDQAESQNRILADRVQRLEALMASADRRPPAPKQAPSAENKASRLITPDEEKDYGADFLDVAARAAREKLDPEIAALKAHINKLEGQLGSTSKFVQRSARENLEVSLNESIPNWREINRDQNFLRWLQLPDPYSGAIRQNMLNDAYTQNDSGRVIAFFNGFLSDEAAVAPARAKPDAGLPTKVTTKVPLETFAAPGRAKTAAAETAPAEKPVITRSQIAQFYSDVQKGKYRGNDAEKDRLERMIFDAEQDGRIQ